jgi:hypothetical protein
VTTEGARAWNFDLIYPAGDRYRASCNRSPFETRCDRIAFQAEASGLIYVVPPDATTPVSLPDNQPEGFPLRPK